MKKLGALLAITAALAGCGKSANDPQLLTACPIDASYLLYDMDPPKYEHRTIDGTNATFMIRACSCPVCRRTYFNTNLVNF